MKNVFYLVGPTATGKSEMAVALAEQCGAEIVNADAFQVYAGLDLLTAKPEQPLRVRVPHHLVGYLLLGEEMNAERFRRDALRAIDEIHQRGKPVIVAGGSGLYVQALAEGLSTLPKADPALRARLQELSQSELLVRLQRLDAVSAQTIDRKNKRRLVRALEICLLSGRPASAQRQRTASSNASGVFLFRERDDLYARINSRVEMMFASGVVDEVRASKNLSPTSAQTLGLPQIRRLIEGEISQAECIAAVQQATRRYAKRQLTWFRRQTNFAPLNLTDHSPADALEWIAEGTSFLHAIR